MRTLMNRLMNWWFQDASVRSTHISGPLIQEQARIFAENLGNNTFKASNGCLDSFLKRHNIVFKTMILTILLLMTGLKNFLTYVKVISLRTFLTWMRLVCSLESGKEQLSWSSVQTVLVVNGQRKGLLLLFVLV